MPHSCIHCPHSFTGGCCICAGHQHGIYGPRGTPEPDLTSLRQIVRDHMSAQEEFVTASNMGELRLSHPEALGIGFDWGALRRNGFAYTRRDEAGVTHLYTEIDGVETEIIAVPAIPVVAPPAPIAAESESQRTVWDHLTDDDEGESNVSR